MRKVKALFVDDQNLLRKQLEENVQIAVQEACGLQLIPKAVSRVEDAKVLLPAGQTEFDLVITDILFPAVGGSEKTPHLPRGLEVIAQAAKTAGVAIVAISIGDTQRFPQLERQALDLGAHVFRYRQIMYDSPGAWDVLAADICTVLENVGIPERATSSGSPDATIGETRAAYGAQVAEVEAPGTSAVGVELPSERIIVFIHGWNSADDAFGAVPRDLAKIAKCSFAIYKYPSKLFGESPSIREIARDFDNWLRTSHKGSSLAIIAHSMGGLVARKFIVDQVHYEKSLADSVRQMTFVASPHHGSSLARLASAVPVLASKQIRELSRDSGFLDELNAHWTSWVRLRMPAGCRIRSIYGTRDSLVKANNAQGLDPEAVPVLGADHTDIFESNQEQLVRTLHGFLEEAGFIPT